VRVAVPQRWVDLDAQGHVNNAVVADYLQEARVAWLLGGDNAHLLGTGTLVVSHQVEYLGPLGFSTAPVEVDLEVGTVGASRYSVGYTVRQDGREAARAHSLLCAFDHAAGRPRRLTPAERAWFAGQGGHLEPFRSLGRWHVGEQAHTQPLVVRWSDLDPYGHVNNVRVFDFVAEARIRMNPAEDVDYLAQVNHRLEPYRVRSAIARLGRTSVTIVAQLEEPADAQVLARTRTVLVCGDASGRPVPLPESMRAAAARWPAEPH
jgi:acyl-CoA thioester hydrolase